MTPPDPNLTLRVAHRVARTEAEGPGRRYALWFQGCPLRCPGCCNPEYLPFHGGTVVTLADITAELDAAAADGVEGVSLLGGEPLAHAAAAAAIARAARQRGLTVMVYSGYTLEEIQANPDPAAADLLAHTDLLVDGRYDRTQPDTERRWVGSRNQRIHFLTDRYRADDPCWRTRNTLELRLVDGVLSVNGFPAPGAVGLWKHLAARRARADAAGEAKADGGDGG